MEEMAEMQVFMLQMNDRWQFSSTCSYNVPRSFDWQNS